MLTPLLTSVILALVVAAEPIIVKRSPVTLPLTRHININGVQNLVQHDQARAKTFKADSKVKSAGTPRQANSQATNEAVSYTTSIGVGSPPTQCKGLRQLLTNYHFTNGLPIFIDDLIIDTGR